MTILLVLILIFFTIYIKFGLLTVVQTLAWSLVFFISNTLLGVNRYSKELITIKWISVFILCLILYNTQTSDILVSALLPFTVKDVSFRRDYDFKFTYDSNISSKIFELYEFYDYFNMADFLSTLDKDSEYELDVIFIPDQTMEFPLYASRDSIFINAESTPWLINSYIWIELENATNFIRFGLWKYTTICSSICLQKNHNLLTNFPYLLINFICESLQNSKEFPIDV
jgi:hypothetical protein